MAFHYVRDPQNQTLSMDIYDTEGGKFLGTWIIESQNLYIIFLASCKERGIETFTEVREFSTDEEATEYLKEQILLHHYF